MQSPRQPAPDIPWTPASARTDRDGPDSVGRESALLARARGGEEAAFEALVAPLRGRLLSVCYQMLGSFEEAEDALQETLVRAWSGLGGFEGRSSVGTWLHSIATRRCLTALRGRRARALPVGHGPPAPIGSGSGRRLARDTWIDPLPTADVGPESAEPGARYELRESVELAFIAAVQHLSPNQRAVLVLRDVLGFSAKETADALDTSVASVTSALARARSRIDERLPRRRQAATLRALGDERLTAIVERYGEAWEDGDVESVVALLSEDASFSMPPLERWFEGREAIAGFLRDEPLGGLWGWRTLPTQANAQPALAMYRWDEDERRFVPFALKVFDFDGDRIAAATSFIATPSPDIDPGPADLARRDAVFTRFGLPPRL